MIIEDGKGRGPKAEVNFEQQLVTASITQKEIEHESEENALAFSWCSKKVNVAAGGDTVLLIKNTSSTPLHIECIKIDNGSLASEYVIHLPTTEVTPTGTTVTGVCWNTVKPTVAGANAKSLETNNSQGDVLDNPFLPVDSKTIYETPGLIIGENKSVAVDVVENTTESSVTIIGHYSD